MTRQILWSMLLIFIVSCAVTKTPKTDAKLVGEWTGHSAINNNRNKKDWTITRNPDGTYVYDLVHFIKNKRYTLKDNGKWWTKNNHYYQESAVKKDTFVLHYNVLNDTEINFKNDTEESTKDGENYNYNEIKK